MIKESVLRDALLEADDFLSESVPLKEDYRHTFSRKTHKKIKRLIFKDKHPLLYTLRNTAAVIALAFVLGSFILIGANKDVRAKMYKWIFEVFQERIYRYHNDSAESVDISKFTLSPLLGDEYRLINTECDKKSKIEIYSDNDDNYLTLYVFSPDYTGDFYLISDEKGQDETIALTEFDAELYISPYVDESNAIVWRTNDDVLIAIIGLLNENELINLATSLQK